MRCCDCDVLRCHHAVVVLHALHQPLARAEAHPLEQVGAQKEQQAGIHTLVDALDAENEFRDAQIARYRAATQLQIAEARLLSLSSELEQQLATLP